MNMLRERIEHDGEALFRQRSLIPLVIVPFAIAALDEGALLDQAMGWPIGDVWTAGALLVSLAGLAIRWATVGCALPGTSGRSTSAPRAEALNTTGMYSVTRNPLYLGNFVAFLGIAIATKAWWFPVMLALAYWIYIERIIAAEEAFLSRKFGVPYEDWAGRTPIFFPRLALWRAPNRRFSFKSVMRREYNGLFAVASSFMTLEFVSEVLIQGMEPIDWLEREWFWPAQFAVAAVVFFTLRTLKRRTRLLQVDVR
jgi:protein-S-isoprenylcysteine O-methyltransferase Ste14